MNRDAVHEVETELRASLLCEAHYFVLILSNNGALVCTLNIYRLIESRASAHLGQQMDLALEMYTAGGEQ